MTITEESGPTATEAEPAAPSVTAVTYQRVSTKEQASKGGREEGFSIPAQREANARKAESLGARIVAEFVDAGESARSADMWVVVVKWQGEAPPGWVPGGAWSSVAGGGGVRRVW